MSAHGFSQRARDYFAARAIDPQLAVTVGVEERVGALLFPYSAADGSTYRRERSLNGAGAVKVKQPAGQPLTLWWPFGRSKNAGAVFLCEGESDALAALEPLSQSRFSALEVAAIPGTGFPVKRLAQQLAEAGTREVFLGLDADDAGRTYAAHARRALDEAGIAAIALELEDGTDLADNLAAIDDRAAWIDNVLADAEAAADEAPTWQDAPAEDGSESQATAARLPPFPVDALPLPIADWAQATATATQTPLDLPAGMALAALSTAALGAATVRCAPDWEEELAVWFVCVLPSGERKSAVLRSALGPVREVERERLEAARATVARKRAERETLEARRKLLTRKVGEGKADPAELGDVAERLAGLGEPVLPRLLADDATPEALAGLLARHGSIGILAAESALLDNLAGRYAEGRANVHLACQAYSGESTSIDRRGRDPEHLECPLLALGLCVQPHVLRRLTADETMREQGFLARVAYMLPTSSVGSRDVDPPPVDAEIASRYRECVQRVAGLGRADTTDQTGREGRSVGSVSLSQGPTLTFSSDAAEAFRDWRAAHELRLAAGTGDLAAVAAWAARHPGRVARLAGLLHLAEHSPEQPITADTFHAAARIGEYLAAHALAALTEERLRAASERAWAWLCSRGRPTVTVRELHRGPVGGGRGTAEEARQVAELLEREGRLRRRRDRPPDPAGGRPPSPTYDVVTGMTFGGETSEAGASG